MDKIKRMFLFALAVAVTSQLYINPFMEDFRVSLSVVLFSVILTLNKNFNSILFSIITGVVVFLFRSLLLIFSGLKVSYILSITYPSILFYIIFGVLFYLLITEVNSKKVIKLGIYLAICDFFSNFMEIFLRINKKGFMDNYDIIKVLIFVALLRSFLAILLISIIKYYKLLVIKEEHENRYRRLVLLVSSLKSEIYFMKRNSDYIEKVMGDSYKLYEGLSQKDDIKMLKELSLSVATDIHEIKKDYIRVIKGVEDIMGNKIQYEKMSLADIFDILEKSTRKFINKEKRDINIYFKLGKNFYTKKHYGLISVFRNLINNAIESIEDSGDIIIEHSLENNNHIFKVIDTGTGIKKRDINHIFNPGFSTKFNKLTGDVNRGLGLTLVKDIIENYYNGNIKIKSIIDSGTVFIVTLPQNELEE
ncbi:MAG: ATP-binding protein [Firmicutes bacterium]|nr:ATP-binding protein [Bacillota bacterium]